MNPEYQYTILGLMKRWGIPPHQYSIRYHATHLTITAGAQTIRVTPDAITTERSSLTSIHAGALCHMSAGITAVLLTEQGIYPTDNHSPEKYE